MKTEIILKLLDAGYTKSDIDKMEETAPAAQTAPAQTAPAPAETAPAADPAPETDTAGQISELITVVSKLQSTVDAMQKSNAQKAESPQPEKLTTRQVLTDFFGEKKKQSST